jgi:hypothetical protein
MAETRSTHEKPARHGESFGAYKPIGYIVIAFDSDDAARSGAQALRDAGVPDADIEQVSAAEQAARMAERVDDASGVAEFGHEIVLTRRYREMAEQGCGWLEVRARNDKEAERIRDAAERSGARLAERYHSLAIEDLIDTPEDPAH